MVGQYNSSMKISVSKWYPLLLASMGTLPLIADAQTIESTITKIGTIINRVIALLFGIAALIFIWGVISYISKQDNEEARKKARNLMLFGIISIAVMAALWALVRILISTFGLENTSPVPTPQIPTL